MAYFLTWRMKTVKQKFEQQFRRLKNQIKEDLR